ncbi:hypothetical protein EVAR_73216_1, partial [Eumeta japonica]
PEQNTKISASFCSEPLHNIRRSERKLYFAMERADLIHPKERERMPLGPLNENKFDMKTRSRLVRKPDHYVQSKAFVRERHSCKLDT